MLLTQLEKVNIQVQIIDNIDIKYKNSLTLNSAQTARILGCSASTLEKRRSEANGIEYITLGKRILYPKSCIAEYLANTVRTH